jgi:hypothetical protein
MTEEKNEVSTSSVDSRTYRKRDKLGYLLILAYSVFHVFWAVWAFSSGFGIFDSAFFVGLFVPIGALVVLGCIQLGGRQKRFSALTNLFAVATIGGWFLFVWYVVASASAMV